VRVAVVNANVRPPVPSQVSGDFRWLELEASIGLLIGLGLGSLTGQRTTSVILMIILEVVLTPLCSRVHIPHFINVQRAVVGVATAHLRPEQLAGAFGG
jgi:hypothetical protein